MKILDYLKKPIIAAALGFVLGLFIGLVVLGWGLWPVQWTNADPSSLRPDLQADYLRMTIDSFVNNPVNELAIQRYQALGADGPAVFERIRAGYPDQNAIKNFASVVQAPTPTATPTPGTGQTPAKPGALTAILIIGGAIILFAILGFAVFKYLIPLFRHTTSDSPANQVRDITNQSEMTNYTALGNEQPIAQFMTTYVLGDDLFDDSFSIDSPSGEFLGECGIGISETIGVGEPKKVTAFEVWLFDKNDIQTVTKVLMSTHAFNDVASFQRLQAKGEPFLVERGKQVVLETAALQLVATASDMEYGQGALPEDSYFERLTLEIAVWPKVVTPA
ncbi:MAG TPA: hypothetical protein VF352_04710 [Anaerolineales bacterium]